MTLNEANCFDTNGNFGKDVQRRALFMKKIKYLVIVLGLTFLLSALFMGCCTNHQYEVVQIYSPTCTEEGYTIFACVNCGERYSSNYISALGHSTYISNAGIAATCTKDGFTDELTCSRCNAIIQARESIPATGHTSIVTKEKLEATCTSTGLCEELHCNTCGQMLQEQTVTEALGHKDLDDNSLCDLCGIPYGDNVIYVDSAEKLKAISNDLSGVYQLVSDIDLSQSPWIALGSETTPFSGYLFGDGYAIKGLSFYNSSNALFSYVSGVIDGVVLEDVSFSSIDFSANMGGLAIYNYGTIKNCSLKGTNTITQSVSRTQSTAWPSYDGSKVAYINVFGGLCSINEGTVSNCRIVNSFGSTFSNKNYFKLKPASLFPPIGAEMYESTCESTIYFGGICGENKGIITNCFVLNADASSINVIANFNKYGSSYAITNAYIGSITGVNSKSVSNCSAKPSVVVENVGSTSTNGSNGGQHPKLNLYMDDTYRGIIGKNDGAVESTLYS